MLRIIEKKLGQMNGLINDAWTPRAASEDWTVYVIKDEYGRQYDCTGGLNSSWRFGVTVFASRDLAEAVLRSIGHLSGE